jgi:acetate kinase
MDGRAVETSDLLPGPDTAGDVDSGLVFRLGREQGLSLAELEALLAERSGLRALSGLSGDPAELEAASTEGHSRAALALDLFAHSVKRAIGACVVVLGALDALTFTGPWGESAAGLRARICRGFPALGVRLDPNLNQTPEADSDGVSDLAEPGSLARILVVPTDIHRMVAAEALATLSRRELAALLRSRRRPIPISISAHHLHLRQEHVEALFGAGHQLTFRSPLSQPGQFACEEAVTLVGPRGRVERVRVLGPVRKDTQVEISRTEEFRLGIDAPVRASGDIHGSPGLRLEGPSDVVDLPEGVIIAARHVHMSPEDALRFGVRDRDAIAVRVEGERGISFRDVVVRVHPDFRLDMHVDTDEGNAAELGPDAVGYMEGIERRV